MNVRRTASPLPGWSVIAGGPALLALVAAWSVSAENPPPGTKAPFVRPMPAVGQPKTDEGGKRLREGTKLIDVEGRFEFTGDRMAFFRADGDESYKVLENLALERINKVLEETRASEKPQWVISGTMTEYNGGNFLLVTKAVIKAQPMAAAPAAREGTGAANSESAAAGAFSRGASGQNKAGTR